MSREWPDAVWVEFSEDARRYVLASEEREPAGLTKDERARLREIATTLREVTEGPDPHYDSQIAFLRSLADRGASEVIQDETEGNKSAQGLAPMDSRGYAQTSAPRLGVRSEEAAQDMKQRAQAAETAIEECAARCEERAGRGAHFSMIAVGYREAARLLRDRQAALEGGEKRYHHRANS